MKKRATAIAICFMTVIFFTGNAWSGETVLHKVCLVNCDGSACDEVTDPGKIKELEDQTARSNCHEIVTGPMTAWSKAPSFWPWSSGWSAPVLDKKLIVTAEAAKRFVKPMVIEFRYLCPTPNCISDYCWGSGSSRQCVP